MKAFSGILDSFPALEARIGDLRFAIRGLARAPAFTAAVFFSLVVCLGPNVAILAVLHALVLEPLPFPEPQQLVVVLNVADKSGGQRVQSSMPQYRDFSDRARLFAGFALVRHESATLEEESTASRVTKDAVSASYFTVLGVQPVLGRFFDAAEEAPGRERVLVLSQKFWASHYGADPAVLGRTVRLGGQSYTIVGVAPRSLESVWPQTCFFQPYAPAASRFNPDLRYRGDVTVYGRLNPGVSPRAALAELTALETHFQTNEASARQRALVEAAGYRLALESLRTGGSAGTAPGLWLLQGGALLVLAIGCVNVVNLSLARLNAKRSEFAIRAALGAGRAALVRQTMTESMLLVGAAAGTGLGAGSAGLRLINVNLPTIMPSAPPVTLDPSVIWASAVAAAAIALLLGFLPLRVAAASALRARDARGSSQGRERRKVSSALVTLQVALAVVLLVGAGLLIRSFANVVAVDPGFDAPRVVEGRIALPAAYRKPADNVGLQVRVAEAMRAIPGVEMVAQAHDAVVAPIVRPLPFSWRGAPASAAGGEPLIHIATVSPEFFGTVGMRVVAGRGFAATDDFGQQPVAIVDQTFVDRYFAGRDVLGQEIHLSYGLPLATEAWARIVGVVNRANLAGLDSRDRLPIVFVPMVRFPVSSYSVLLRTSRPAAEVLREMRGKMHGIDPTLPLYAAGTLEERLENLLTMRRGLTLLLGAFAGVALVLAAIGLYGVLSYDVSQRTREIGIRGAIGASRRQIVNLVVRQGMTKTAIGTGVGLLGAWFLTRYLRGMLFGVSPADPASYVVVMGALAAVALLACWWPARRAAKVDPIVALRAE